MANARKRNEEASKAKRKLLALPTRACNKRKTLSTLLAGKKNGQSEPETLMLAIPCAVDKPDRLKPIYLVVENEFGGPESGVWQCEQCTAIYYTRKAWKGHVGLIPNVKGTCEAI